MDFEKVIGQLQDTMTVVVGIQTRQAASLGDHQQWLEDHDRFMRDHQTALERQQQA